MTRRDEKLVKLKKEDIDARSLGIGNYSTPLHYVAKSEKKQETDAPPQKGGGKKRPPSSAAAAAAAAAPTPGGRAAKKRKFAVGTLLLLRDNMVARTTYIPTPYHTHMAQEEIDAGDEQPDIHPVPAEPSYPSLGDFIKAGMVGFGTPKETAHAKEVGKLVMAGVEEGLTAAEGWKRVHDVHVAKMKAE